MSRRTPNRLLPTTPGSRHALTSEVYADKVEIDDEIIIKSSLLRECKPGNPWFEGAGLVDEDSAKKVVRKSTELRRIKSEKKRIEAILSSPMIDARPRRSTCSNSYTEGLSKQSPDIRTPLRLPEYKDFVPSTSRRLSRIILNRCGVEQGSRDGSNLKNLRCSCLQGLDNTSVGHFEVTRIGSNATEKENRPPSSLSDSVNNNELCNTTNPDCDPNNSRINKNDPSSIAEFRVLADYEIARLISLCGDWNAVLDEEVNHIPESASDAIRATVGKCQLLLNKKIPFFKSLIELAEKSSDVTEQSAVPNTGINDLLGYWTLVADEIHRADSAFERLRIWRDKYNWAVDHRPITPVRPNVITNRKCNKSSQKKNPKRIATSNLKKNLSSRSSELETGSSSGNALATSREAKDMKSKNKSIKSKFAEFLAARKAAANNSGHRQKSNLLEALTPLGLRPVTGTPSRTRRLH